MRHRACTSCELAQEAVEHIPWLLERLLEWFERSGRSFPWRDPRGAPYEVIVEEILFKRTRATGVARACSGFIGRYPSWVALAQSTLEDLENALRPLGLWRQKVRTFQHLAQSIEEGRDLVLCSRAELEGLHGIGPYTAGAVLAIRVRASRTLIDVRNPRMNA